MKLKRNLRVRKFIDAYIENNGNATKAFLTISPNAKNPRQYGYRMLQKVDISVSEFFDKAGITDIHLSKKLKEGLDATKVISVIPIPPKEAKPGTGNLPNATSKNIEFIDVPDFNVRVKYLDMAYKLKDKYPSEKHKLEVEGDIKIKVKLPKDDRS